MRHDDPAHEGRDRCKAIVPSHVSFGGEHSFWRDEPSESTVLQSVQGEGVYHPDHPRQREIELGKHAFDCVE